MDAPLLQLIPLALVATLSPLAFAATLAVIGSGRLKALCFAVGFVTGQLLACAILVALGTVAVPQRDRGHGTSRALLELGLGIALLWLAALVRRQPERAQPTSNGRSKAALERLGRLRPGTAVAAGLLLGGGGPKRLVLTALAAATIAAASPSNLGEAALVGWYTALATLFVWGPIATFVLVGDRAVAWFDATQAWLVRHHRDAMFYPLVVIGLGALAGGVVALT